MPKLSDLFDVAYGNKFDLNKMTRLSVANGGVYFVGRSRRNQGVSGEVRPLASVSPYQAGLITVALGGNPLASFVQQWQFYTAQNVAVLSPLMPMSLPEKLFLCLCIARNRYRYSAFGREANRTLRELEIPDKSDYPEWIAVAKQDVSGKESSPKRSEPAPPLQVDNWKPFALGALFELKKGKRLTKADQLPGSTPFIGALNHNNGVATHVGQPPLHPENTITVNYNGNGGVAEAFYQSVPYLCSDDVNVLYPKFPMTPGIAMFIVALIRREKYRFSFGRKWHLERMVQSEIKLPATDRGEPDWETVQRFIDSLPYSASL